MIAPLPPGPPPTRNIERYSEEAYTHLCHLITALGLLDTPKHYLSALVAIGRWLEEKERAAKEGK